MAIKLTFKAYVEKIDKHRQAKNGNYFRKIVVRQPAFRNQFDEKIGEDNFFELLEFRSDERFSDRHKLARAKVEVTCYVNGREHIDPAKGAFYTTTFRLKELKRISNGKEES